MPRLRRAAPGSAEVPAVVVLLAIVLPA
jgi:hypothetical protein